jgi:hypothetical protein
VELAQMAGIPALVLLTAPEAQVVQLRGAQVTAQLEVQVMGLVQMAVIAAVVLVMGLVQATVVTAVMEAAPALVLLTAPEAQVVQLMVAQVTAQLAELVKEAVVVALDQLEVQVTAVVLVVLAMDLLPDLTELMGEQLTVPDQDQPEALQMAVALTVPEALATELAQMVETVLVLAVAIAVVVLVMVQVQAEVMEQVTVATALTVAPSLMPRL